jgi:hypothetical protein
MLHDRYTLPLSTSSADAARAYQDGIDRALAGDAGIESALERAVAADEGFALAHIALARNLQFRGQVAEARASAARARELAGSATRRERQHVEAIATAIDGDPPKALDLIREHLSEFPRDAFALTQANGVYGLIGFSGRQDRNEEQLALLESVAQAYGDDWWFLGAHGFALTEMFRFAEARPLIERSLEAHRRNAHGAHSMAHVLYETGDAAGGSAFLDDWLPDYQPGAVLHGHLAWHLALCELAAGRYSRVKDIYTTHIGPASAQSQALGVVADSASLLWRCHVYGCATTPLPWQELRDYVAKSFPRPGVMFADVHAALAYAAAGDQESLSQLTQALREREAQGKIPGGTVVPALAEGLGAFGRGDYDEAVRLLEPVAGEVVRIGGSHAQREVFEDTLLEAYLRTGRGEQAEQLLLMRLERRPWPRDHYWLGRARQAAGHPDATSSLRTAHDLWSSADPDSVELDTIRRHLAESQN